MRRRESRRRSRHNRTSKSPAMWPGFLAAQIVREYSLLLIFLCKIFPEKLDKARGGRRGILDSPFQSTPPARGATTIHIDKPNARQISIHAPREGGRRRRSIRARRGRAFQSTPPRGGRPRPSPPRSCPSYFNPRPPRGGRRHIRHRDTIQAMISIHAPARGATYWRRIQRRQPLFQSTPPARGATRATCRG